MSTQQANTADRADKAHPDAPTADANMNAAAPENERFNWRIFGPGILMATAAIGGSHLISSTQAGAIYGWQLAIMIVLANVFKYPFFRFATDYVYDTGESLIAGYASGCAFGSAAT